MHMANEITQEKAKEIVLSLAAGSKRTIIGIVGKPGGGSQRSQSIYLKAAMKL